MIRNHFEPYRRQPLRDNALPNPRDSPHQRNMDFRMHAAMVGAPRIEKAKPESYPVVPFSRMAQMQDTPLERYQKLFLYISERTGAHPSVSDAVALVLLNQFLSIPAGFDLGAVSYTRPQRVFSREQLMEFMNSMRVLEISFNDGYPDWDSNGGRTGLFRAKTVVPSLHHRNPIGPPSSYLDLYGQVVKSPPQGFDLVFLSYTKKFIPGRDELEDMLLTSLAEGKHKMEWDMLAGNLYESLSTLSKTDAAAVLMEVHLVLGLTGFGQPNPDIALILACVEKPAQKARASESLFVLATGCEEDPDTKIPAVVIAAIRGLAGLIARIESEADSASKILPVDPKGLIETIARHAVGSRGALIVSGDTCDTPPDTFRAIKSFQDGGVVLYQRND